MNCTVCGKPAMKGYKLCKPHFIEAKEEEYLDNSDINNLGIVKWAKEVIPEYLSNKIPFTHYEIYKLALELFNPALHSRLDRQLELINHRGSGKSTLLAFILPLYILCHNNKKIKFGTWENTIVSHFMVIISKTGGMAEDFVVRLRDEFTANSTLKWFYGGKIEDATDASDGQWTRRAFKYNGVHVLGIGTGMQIRGRIKGAYRPDFLIFDDIYDEENIKTEDQRTKIRSWFNAGAMNTLDPINGKAILSGTILHDDTVLIDAKKSDLWTTVEFPLMDATEFKRFVADHLENDYTHSLCKLKYDDVEDKIERITKQKEYYDNCGYKTNWNDRFTIYTMAQMYKEAVMNNSIGLFYQEYFHIVVSEENKKFRPEYFQKIGAYSITEEYGIQWFESALSPEPVPIQIEIGVDMAGGTKEGDESVITVLGVLPQKRLVVLEQIAGKFSLRDVTTTIDARYNNVISDTSHIIKTGLIDELFRTCKRYKPFKVKFGIAGEEKLVVEEIRRVFMNNGMYINVIPRPQTSGDGNKFERIKNTLLPKYETYNVYHTPNLQGLEAQLEFLGKTKNDDRADSLEVAMWHTSEVAYVSKSLFRPLTKKVSVFSKKKISSEYDWRLN